jgi:hypothetical protein
VCTGEENKAEARHSVGVRKTKVFRTGAPIQFGLIDWCLRGCSHAIGRRSINAKASVLRRQAYRKLPLDLHSHAKEDK